jgi:ubiquinone biosynthesis protein UbiJ
VTPGLLTLLQRGLNRALALDPELRGVLAPIEGTRLGVEVTGAAPIVVIISLTRDGVVLEPGAGDAGAGVDSVHAAVSGSPAALLGLLTSDDEMPFGAGVSVRGDIAVLQRVSRAARRLRPDWEEPIARLFGDEIGQPLSRSLRHAYGSLAHLLRELNADAGEYLREESGLVVAAEDMDAFIAGVDELRDAAERLEKRIELIARCGARRP